MKGHEDVADFAQSSHKPELFERTHGLDGLERVRAQDLDKAAESPGSPIQRRSDTSKDAYFWVV